MRIAPVTILLLAVLLSTYGTGVSASSIPATLVGPQLTSARSPVFRQAYALSTPPLHSLLAPTTSPPRFAFDGAYADYNVIVSGFAIHGFVYRTSVGYLVNSLDASSGTFSVETNYGGEFSYLSTTVTASFESPFPLPAVNVSDLSSLNEGEVPDDMIAPPNMTSDPLPIAVKPNVTVTLPAGIFVVDELSLANGSQEWVATQSGLVVRQTGAFSASSWPDGVYGTMVLASTNIRAGGQPFDYGLLGANATLVVMVAIAVVVAWRAGRRNPAAERFANMRGAGPP